MQPELENKRVGFVIGGRKNGKTSAMIEWAYGHPDRVIVVHSRASQLQVYTMAKHMRRTLNDDQVISLDSVRSGGLRGRNVVLGVDNIEMLFARFLDSPVGMVTATGHIVPITNHTTA